MNRFDGSYSGAALQAFVQGLEQSQSVVQKILGEHGLKAIDPSRWYDLNTARSIYDAVGKHVGPRTLRGIGLKMIETASLPPNVTDVSSVLATLDAAYNLNVRGPEIGNIRCTFDGDRNAAVEFTTPFPCSLSSGIIQGCVKKYGALALIEHGANGCVDQGAGSCTYRVTW
jgi:hypothetical protein